MKKKSVFSRVDEFVYGNFKQSLKYVANIKNYIWFSCVLFFCVALFGFMLPIFFQEQVLQLIKEIILKTEGLGTLNMIRFIFINNLKSSFFAMVLGIFFGIIPLVIVVVNAYVLGFVANKTIVAEGWLILWRLLPHGIFELPAVLISISLGLKLGSFLFTSKNKGWKEFWKWLKDVIRVFILIVIPLLVIAGIIEGLLIIFVG